MSVRVDVREAPWYDPFEQTYEGIYVVQDDLGLVDHVCVYIREAADGPDVYRAEHTVCGEGYPDKPADQYHTTCPRCMNGVVDAFNAGFSVLAAAQAAR